jgi:hypothetical protein
MALEKEKILDTKINEMVYYELKSYEDFMSNSILQNPDKHPIQGSQKEATRDTMHIDDSKAQNIISKLHSFPNQYDRLSIEIKARAFKGESLPKVEKAYYGFHKFDFKILAGHTACFSESHVKELLKSIQTACESIEYPNKIHTESKI